MSAKKAAHEETLEEQAPPEVKIEKVSKSKKKSGDAASKKKKKGGSSGKKGSGTKKKASKKKDEDHEEDDFYVDVHQKGEEGDSGKEDAKPQPAPRRGARAKRSTLARLEAVEEPAPAARVTQLFILIINQLKIDCMYAHMIFPVQD
jgi:hypothetical protein